jgi:hypothetical protein
MQYQIESGIPLPPPIVTERQRLAQSMESIRHWLYTIDKNIPKNRHDITMALIFMFSRQTRQEQIEKETISYNKMGFSSGDASYLSNIALWYLASKAGESISKSEAIEVARRLRKYAKQLDKWNGEDCSLLAAEVHGLQRDWVFSN